MYEDAKNIGLVSENPFANLRLPATEKTAEVAPPTRDELIALLNGCRVLGPFADEFRALILFAAWTGLRAGEIQALRWGDIDEEVINVRRSRKTDNSYGRPKNGLEREVAFMPPARVLDKVERRSGSDLVFHTATGKPLSKSNLYYPWNNIRNASGTSLARIEDGIKPVRFHDLRHFCATQLLERGLDHFAVSVQLGHTDGGALVMARYGHPSADRARERLLRSFSVEPSGQVAGLVAS